MNILLVGVFPVQAGTGNNYPWQLLTKDSISDTWGYPIRECTSWVAWALHDRNGFETPPIGGNAAGWGVYASAHNYTVNNRPAIGAVAWWAANTLDKGYNVGSWGHVAYVKAINPDCSVAIEEYNVISLPDYPGGDGAYHTRDITPSGTQNVQFIHFKDMSVPKNDFGIWRLMNTYDGTWYVAKNENGIANELIVNGCIHGSPGDIPLSADFNKDGIADMVIYRLINGVGTWYVEDGVSPHGHLAIWGAQFGVSGDIPVVGDFNGDGYADFGVWRIVNGIGTWYIINGTNGQPIPSAWGVQHGSPGDIPVVGDFNGDKTADFGIYRVISGTGYWYFKSGINGQPIPSAWGIQHGSPGDIPVVGDFDGDGYSDFGIYRPINGTGYWYVRSGVDVGNMIINGATQGGWPGDVPFGGNFN